MANFESDLDKMVQKAWAEERVIGWDQILKGRLSRYCRITLGIFTIIAQGPEERCVSPAKYESQQHFEFVLDFSLNLWNDSCGTIHGVDENDAKRIIKLVDELHATNEGMVHEYGCLLEEGAESMCKRSTQYRIKWRVSFMMAEYIIARWKVDDSVGGDTCGKKRRHES